MRDRIEYTLVRFLGGVVRRLSPAQARGLAVGLGRFVWWLGIRRGVADDNLRHAFPQTSTRERARICRASYEALVLTATEFLRLTPARLRTPEMAVHFDGWEHLAAAQAAGRGAIVASAHLGNWELCGSATALRGLRATLVVQKLRNARLDEALNRGRRALGLHVVERGMAMRNIESLLRDNYVVALMCDQDARRRGVFVPFFGRLASTHKGAAQLAFRFGVPLIPFLCYRDDTGRHRVEIHAPLGGVREGQGREGQGEGEFVEASMAEFHRQLEQVVRRYPSQYLWLHRRWKTRAPEAAAATMLAAAGEEPLTRQAVDGSQ